jgi:hypothetical protein
VRRLWLHRGRRLSACAASPVANLNDAADEEQIMPGFGPSLYGMVRPRLNCEELRRGQECRGCSSSGN